MYVSNMGGYKKGDGGDHFPKRQIIYPYSYTEGPNGLHNLPSLKELEKVAYCQTVRKNIVWLVEISFSDRVRHSKFVLTKQKDRLKKNWF